MMQNVDYGKCTVTETEARWKKLNLFKVSVRRLSSPNAEAFSLLAITFLLLELRIILAQLER